MICLIAGTTIRAAVIKDLINTSLLDALFRTTVLAMAAFLDAFQKVADMATNTRGKISVEAEKWKKERKKKESTVVMVMKLFLSDSYSKGHEQLYGLHMILDIIKKKSALYRV